MSRNINDLHPRVKPRFQAFLKELRKRTGKDIKFSWTYRTAKQQNEMVVQGRSQARHPMSWHNNTDILGKPAALAVDIFNNVPGKLYDIDWKIVKKVCEEFDLEWGGLWHSFPDKPHIQYTEGYSRWDLITNPSIADKFLSYKPKDIMEFKHDYVKIMKKEVPKKDRVFNSYEGAEAQIKALIAIAIYRANK